MTSFSENVDLSVTESSSCKGISSEMKSFPIKDTCMKNVKFRSDNIKKFQNDKNEYRGLILSNEMKVLLISNPTTNKCAAALNVQVGSLSNPREIPGLSCLCQHMLQNRNKNKEIQSPMKSNYAQYLLQNTEICSFFSSCDNTCYSFHVNADKLEGELDRFFKLFFEPQFTKANMEQEIKCINFENEKALEFNVEFNNYIQLEHSSANPNHPYSQINKGSLETLDIIPKQKNIDVLQEVVNFHNKWYSSNIMTLSVFGKESLEDLEKMVVNMFSGIENKNVEAPKWTHPFNEEQLQCKWYMPFVNKQKMVIIFPIPDLREYYQSSPVSYLEKLFEYKEENSLLSILKKKGWIRVINDVELFKNDDTRGFSFFKIYFNLTKNGLNHIDDIITVLFQYINMIKKQEHLEPFYNFIYPDEGVLCMKSISRSTVPYLYVSNIVNIMPDCPIEEIINRFNSLFFEWRPDLIKKLVDYLTPENIRVHIFDKSFENIATEIEPIYKSKFKKEKIPANLIEKWRNAGDNCDLKLPTRNELIPTKFDLKLENSVIEKYPKIIQDTRFMRVWFKQDDEFFLPEAYMTFNFVSPFAYINPINFNNNCMFVKLLQDSLKDYAKCADLIGLKFILSATSYGINFKIEGYDHKQDVLIEKIMDKMINFKINEKNFENMKEKYMIDLENLDAYPPFRQAKYYCSVLLTEKAWDKNDLLGAYTQLTVESARDYMQLFFSNIHVESLIYGNITKDEALKIGSLIESKLTSAHNFNKGNIKPLLPMQCVPFREVSLAPGSNYWYETQSIQNNESCTSKEFYATNIYYYQIGSQSIELNMLLELFYDIIRQPCFEILSLKEDLGHVWCDLQKSNDINCLELTVAGRNYPQNIEERINIFIKSMEDYIKNMCEEEFNENKEIFAVNKLRKPETMSNMFSSYWNEISSQVYNFDRKKIEATYLRTITKEQLCKFYENYISDNAQFRKKLSIHAISSGEVPSELKEQIAATKITEDQQPIRITDIDAFKIKHSLNPLPQPFNNIPRKGMLSKL
ncbi:insulin-degrading enzyme-like [Leptopilina boulardi]|uniref:insulin-degrading enzyme-like n=1 Tax=Leptopilina boulardi TaxID=63433 RepID=UPI0021F68912|nr:insulin-degrading enzyme-like [Leptopilina boulardi]